MAIVLKSTALENTYTIRIRMTLTKKEVGTPCAWKYCVGHIAGDHTFGKFYGTDLFFFLRLQVIKQAPTAHPQEQTVLSIP